MRKTRPDIRQFNPDPEYLRGLIEGSRFSYEEVAREIGVSERTLYNWLSKTRGYKYTDQFTVERLCA